MLNPNVATYTGKNRCARALGIQLEQAWGSSASQNSPQHPVQQNSPLQPEEGNSLCLRYEQKGVLFPTAQKTLPWLGIQESSVRTGSNSIQYHLPTPQFQPAVASKSVPPPPTNHLKSHQIKTCDKKSAWCSIPGRKLVISPPVRRKLFYFSLAHKHPLKNIKSQVLGLQTLVNLGTTSLAVNERLGHSCFSRLIDPIQYTTICTIRKEVRTN
jgi:hypothetical protein